MRLLVTLPILAIMALSASAQDQVKGEPPAKRELFAKEEWYKDQKGNEQPFVGVLSVVKAGGGAGIGRFNPYRLTITLTDYVRETFQSNGKDVVRVVPVNRSFDKEVYVGAQAELLAPYVGKTVKLVGKPVQIEVVGKVHNEIWPATLEVLTAEQLKQEPAQAGPPAKRELFAKEDWYVERKSREIEFLGYLSRIKAEPGAGNARFNPYRLTMTATYDVTVTEKAGNVIVTKVVPVTTQAVHEVFVGTQTEVLAPYVDKTVKFIGKAVKMGAGDNAVTEIWPARLEVVDEQQKVPGKQLKVQAETAWPGATADPNAPQKGAQFVIRDPLELANHYPWNLLDALPQVVAKQAEAQITKMLGVDPIDWKKQMLVVITPGVRPTGGFKVEINGLTVADGKLTVKWRELKPDGAAIQALTHPSKMILLERVDGAVSFVNEGAAKSTIKPLPIRPGIRPLPINPKQVPPGVLPIPVEPKQDPAKPRIDFEEVRFEEQDAKESKVLAQTTSRLVGGKGGHLVIRTEDELAKAAGGTDNADVILARIAKQLKVESIDLKKQMLVVINGGTKRTGGYSVSVNGTKVDGKALVVLWKLNTPPPGSIVTQALTNPGATALVERFEGEVRFDPAAAAGGLKGPRPID